MILLEALSQIKNNERALQDKAYHKSCREHWGVSAPLQKELIRTHLKESSQHELIKIASNLWKTNIFDPMILATRILCLPKVNPSGELWELILDFLPSMDGWGLEDGLAPAAWKCILADRSLLERVEKWTEHPNFWVRRAALVYTLPFAKPNRDPERMLVWASRYAKDSEWFIQKAIGWWLRVLGGHNPNRVAQFLNRHWNDLKYVARKEATRKLKTDWRLLIEPIHS